MTRRTTGGIAAAALVFVLAAGCFPGKRSPLEYGDTTVHLEDTMDLPEQNSEDVGDGTELLQDIDRGETDVQETDAWDLHMPDTPDLPGTADGTDGEILDLFDIQDTQETTLEVLPDEVAELTEVEPETQAPDCGNGECEIGENESNCPADCNSGTCGDGECKSPENVDTCPQDCKTICGDNLCKWPESVKDCPEDCAGTCGDDECKYPDDVASCPWDCVTTCGDETCKYPENVLDCPSDCLGTCGDLKCKWPDTAENCPGDCSGNTCGDGICTAPDNVDNCPADCSTCGDGICQECFCTMEGVCVSSCIADCINEDGTGCFACGNQHCEPGESPVTCPQDCSNAQCGDGLCDPAAESPETCPADCGTSCGNGSCQFGENMNSCPADCGGCGDGKCQQWELAGACPGDCPAACGDGICDPAEKDKCLPDCPTEICVKNCGGDNYGPDGCGGCCQTCGEFEMCQGGVCVGAMATVAKGSFFMGCNAVLDSVCTTKEKPQHLVSIVYDYKIDVTEVTNAAFAVFLTVNGNSCLEAPEGPAVDCANTGKSQVTITEDGMAWEPAPGMGQHPVVGVTFYGAKTYCKWLGRRLCSEAEWEKAARGDCDELWLELDPCKEQMPTYPWGTTDPESDCTLANWAGGGCAGINPGTTEPVGSHPGGLSQFHSLLDMAGNVAELTADCWHGGFGGDMPTDGSPWQTSCSMQGAVRKGGCFFDNATCDVRSPARDYLPYDETSSLTGFRCCNTVAE